MHINFIYSSSSNHNSSFYLCIFKLSHLLQQFFRGVSSSIQHTVSSYIPALPPSTAVSSIVPVLPSATAVSSDIPAPSPTRAAYIPALPSTIAVSSYIPALPPNAAVSYFTLALPSTIADLFLFSYPIHHCSLIFPPALPTIPAGSFQFFHLPLQFHLM